MEDSRKKLKIIREAASKLGAEPENLLQTVQRFKKEISECEREIKKLKS